MKQRIFLGLLVFGSLFISQQMKAQAFLGALAFGGNLTQVDGDEVYGFHKFGFNVGVSAIYPFNKKWALSVEASYSQKGSYEKYPVVDDPTKGLPYYDLRLSYLEVPFFLYFTDKEFLSIGAGFSWGRLVGIKEIEWGKTIHSSITNSPYNMNDINAILNIRVPIWKRLKLDFRYAYSISKIRTRNFHNDVGDSWDRDQYNNIITFRLVYVFNEKIDKKEN
jgi:hypothetical protein